MPAAPAKLGDLPFVLVTVTQGATTKATYSHNALGQRALKTRPGNITNYATIYLYNPAGQLISETSYDNAGNVEETKHYIWLGMMPIAMLQPAANEADQKIVYLHSDHLETPRKATNQNQEVVWQWHSDAFGTDAANDDPDSDGIATFINLRFPGQYFDKETNLHYNYFRDYDPNVGRYVQSDPIGLRASWNTYGYVAASPIQYSDPNGLIVGYIGVIAVVNWTRNYWNEPVSSLSDVKNWTELTAKESIYHRMGEGNGNNRKFVSEDGHSEAVFDCNGDLVNDDLNGGTYNFFGPGYLGGVPHILADVIPYYIFGTSPLDMVNGVDDRVKATWDLLTGNLSDSSCECSG